MPSTRTILWVTTLLSAFVFLGMTVDSLHKMGARTHADQLSAQVVEGKWVWQHYDCNDCHTILGIGGYYAPDVTKSYAIRGDAWLRQFLKEPGKMYPTGRQMPNFHLADAQIDSLVAYLKWVSEVDTNGWPPAPLGVARAGVPGYQDLSRSALQHVSFPPGQRGNAGARPVARGQPANEGLDPGPDQ